MKDTNFKILEKAKKQRICIIGDVILDHYIFGNSERLSPEAPVPVVLVEKDVYKAGAAANVALNIRSFGAKAELFGCVGEDMTGKHLKAILEEKQINVFSFEDEFTTIVKTRVIVRNQQICRIDREKEDFASDCNQLSIRLRNEMSENKINEMKKNDMISSENFDAKTNLDGRLTNLDRRLSFLEQILSDCQAVILSDYAKGVISQEMIDWVCKLKLKYGFFLGADPKPKNEVCYKGVDLLTPNKMEAFELAGINLHKNKNMPLENVCRIIYEKHPTKYLVITLGSDGMLLCEDGQIKTSIPTYAREVFDVSGAGDTSIAALVLGLSCGFPLESVAHFANTASGIVVGKYGTALASPEEILSYHA